MSLYNGILHLTNWTGNVIMPTLGALFIAVAVIQFARGYHNLYSTWAYGGLICLMVSGLLRMFEKFTGQLGWNNPDLYWNSLLNLVDWFANVILPVYAGMHVAVGALKFGGLFEEHVWPILATRDVRYSDERVPAIRGSRVEYSGPHPIQVRETAWLPAGLVDVSHEAARVLRTGVRLRTAHGIPEGGILNATNAPPMGRFAAPARALRTTAGPRLSRWLHHPHQRVLRSGL